MFLVDPLSLDLEVITVCWAVNIASIFGQTTLHAQLTAVLGHIPGCFIVG